MPDSQHAGGRQLTYTVRLLEGACHDIGSALDRAKFTVHPKNSQKLSPSLV